MGYALDGTYPLKQRRALNTCHGNPLFVRGLSTNIRM